MLSEKKRRNVLEKSKVNIEKNYANNYLKPLHYFYSGKGTYIVLHDFSIVQISKQPQKLDRHILAHF